MVVMLKRFAAHPVNREQFLEKFNFGKKMEMVQGTPLLVCVQGTYIKASELLELVANRKDYKAVSDWLNDLKNPVPMARCRHIDFVWRR